MEPSPPLQELLTDILNQDPALELAPLGQTDHPTSATAPKTNLRLQLTSFIGREREVAEVSRLLGTTRLLTLVGAGGIGKTRLALAVASHLIEDHADGVWLVELAAVTDPALVPQVVLATLDFGADPVHTPMESLISVLTTREILCVIDNCEHLVEACARLADTLLRHCPRLSILATSRDVLRVEGEIIWRVPPLATTPERPNAESREALARLEAVQLFVERAAAVRTSFRLTDDNAASVARICQRIDGIPLAIELAAARVRGMSVAVIEEHLEDCFQLLTGGSRVSTPRQRTLQATLDWSHDLLTDNEKRLFRRLSVFRGGFTLAAAETICSNEESGGAGVPVLDDLTSLVDKSLVVWEEGSDQSGRYRLLEPVRQYAHDRLSEPGEADWTQHKHALFYNAFGEAISRGLRGPRQPVWVARVEDELDNLRASFEWALGHDPTAALQLVLALERYWTVSHFIGVGRDWLNRALQAAPDQDELRGNGLYNACWWAFVQGQYDEARRLGRECLSLAQRLASALISGQALTALACVAMAEGREVWVAVSLPLCERAERHLRRANDPVTLARQLNNIGTVLQAAGDLISAQAKLEEAVGLARALGDTWLIVNDLDGLAGIEFDTGDTAAAEAHWKEALALAGGIRSQVKAMLILIGLALLAQLNGRPRRCLRLLGAAAALQTRMGWVLSSASPAMARALPEAQAAARGLMGQEAADTAWREGGRMSLAEAVRYGLDEPSETTATPGATLVRRSDS